MHTKTHTQLSCFKHQLDLGEKILMVILLDCTVVREL